ncbi:hypothetical protein F4820DRAFT_452028 [Hypoxylon rubiginosum]|uniref:Uncharacterized protein n=1 Tax=Hypoxylon rubiginosum TaxID=110542 RepID=A0ACB9YPK8_9PEZI|nr:hypothetical protein F4820DRAFT_452028 [Hypoxylon rubiginosum]
MKTFSLLSSLSMAAAAIVSPPTNAFNQLPNGYTLGNITWKGNVTNDGPEVSFTGPSFRDIEAQIFQMNPSFTWPEQNTTGLSDFPEKSLGHLTCDLANFYWAKKFRIDDGINYLKGKTGRCYIEAGPKVCSRISCSFHSAIFWCNDNDTPLWIDCGLWSQYAQNIVDACTIDDPSQEVKGQQFDTDNWNIIVGYSEC